MITSVAEIAARGLTALLAPQTCAVCGGAAEAGIPVCDRCLEERYYREAANPRLLRCSVCGRPLLSAINRCVGCRTEKGASSPLDGIHVLYPYDSANQLLLTAWKIAGLRGLSPYFARCFALALARLDAGERAVIPVPPRPGKIRERGWDQMEEIAAILRKRHRVNVMRPLTRKSAIQQKKLGHEERLMNLKGAIRCERFESYPPNVYVIDDLTATGSTLEACAEALKSAGAGKVYGLALFYD